jgi:hypothetical protein
VTISTGNFDEYGIPQGSRNLLDDLADVDTTEAKEGNTIQLRGGRWVNVAGDEVSIQPSQPSDPGVELWVNPDEPEPPPPLDYVTADARYVNVDGDSITGVVHVPTPAAGSVTTQVVNAQFVSQNAPTKTGGGASGSWAISASQVAGLWVHSGRNNQANQIVRTNASGYLDVTYINSDSPVHPENPSNVIGMIGADGYYRKFPTGYLQVDYAHRSGTDGQVWRSGTIVMTTTASGTGGIDVGRTVNNVVMANGDFNAHPRAATCTSFGGTAFYYANTNASAVIRINWMVG